MEAPDVILMLAASESQNTDSSPAPHLGPIEHDNVPSVEQSSYVTSPYDQGFPPSSTTSAKPAQEMSLLGSSSFPKIKSGFDELACLGDATSVKDDRAQPKDLQYPRRFSPVGLPGNGTNAGAAQHNSATPMQDTSQRPLSTPAQIHEHVCLQVFPTSAKDDRARPKNLQYPCRCSPVGLPGNGTNAGAAQHNFATPMLDTSERPLSEATVAEGDDQRPLSTPIQIHEHVCCWKKFIRMAEWVVFFCVTGLLIASLTIHKLQKTNIWELELWKWCVLVLAIFLGRLVSELLITMLGFLIEKLWLREKGRFYLYKLTHSVQVFIWLFLVLLVWVLLIYPGPKRSRHAKKTLSHVTRALASCLVAATIWLVKRLLIKLVDASFHFNASLEPIYETIKNQYKIETLLENQSMEKDSNSKGRLSFMKAIGGEEENLHEVFDKQMLTNIKQRRISAWNVRRLINAIIHEWSPDRHDQTIDIHSKAEQTAEKIIYTVEKKTKEYNKLADILSHMKTEGVAKCIPSVQGSDGNRRIHKPTLEKWLESVYRERQSLAGTLKDGDTVINDLNTIVSAIVFLVITIVGLIIMRLLTTQTLILISSQLVLVAFMFGNTARTVFEAIIFIFVTHPFDVRDRCVVDGVQLVVKKIDILTTTFVRYDGEKIFYPNSVLATKPISNLNRSDDMSDSVEFTIDFFTSPDDIENLKKEVEEYMGKNRDCWKNHSIVVKEIEDVNKLKMGLNVTHAINFQNPGVRSSRISQFVLELKRILQKHQIKNRPLPQEVQVSYAKRKVAGRPQEKVAGDPAGVRGGR